MNGVELRFKLGIIIGDDSPSDEDQMNQVKSGLTIGGVSSAEEDELN